MHGSKHERVFFFHLIAEGKKRFRNQFAIIQCFECDTTVNRYNKNNNKKQQNSNTPEIG